MFVLLGLGLCKCRGFVDKFCFFIGCGVLSFFIGCFELIMCRNKKFFCDVLMEENIDYDVGDMSFFRICWDEIKLGEFVVGCGVLGFWDIMKYR